MPQLCMHHLLKAKSKLLKNRAGGEDDLVAEMLSHLPWCVLLLMLRTFQDRMQGNSAETLNKWQCVTLMFIAKVSTPSEMSHWRGISLLSVMSKLDVENMACGFVPGHRAEEVTEGIRAIVARSAEWGQHAPVYVWSGDVLTAFDLLSHDLIESAMRFHSIHPGLMATYFAELTGLEATASLQEVATAVPFPFNRSGRQGGVETPWIWNMVMAMILYPLRELG